MTPTSNKTRFNPAIVLKTAELVERLRWVIGIRWTVVVALLVVGLVGPNLPSILNLRPYSFNSSMVHVGLAVVVAAYNLFYLLASRRPDFGKTRGSYYAILAEVPIDLCIFTIIVHFSGGVTGPVFVLYFLYIFVGLAILPPSGAYVVAAIAAVCYGELAYYEAMSGPTSGAAAIPDSKYWGYFLTVAATLMITAYIANYFAGLLTRDERTIRQQLNEINTLYTVTRSISGTLSGDDVARTLVTRAMELEDSSACALLLFNDRGEGIFVASRGYSADETRLYHSSPLPPDHIVVRTITADRKGIYAPNADREPGLRAVLARAATRSFYAIPMYNEDRLIGTLNLSFDRQYTMPMNRWHLLSAMTQQGALAIERSRLFADAQRAAREMTGLYHIGLATTSSLNIDEVVHLIYEQVNRVLHPDTFYIALYDEDAAELRYDIFIEGTEALPPFKTRIDSAGISGWVVRNRKPIFVRHWDAEIEQLPFEANVVGAPTQSLISVPLIAKNKIVGVMSVQAVQAGAFDQNHLRLLTSIAGQAALALENARLHATVNEQAQRDPLTGVFHHGSFLSKLQSAIKQAHADKQTVALIMLDIDKFKQYNDTYGHLVGDDVLRSTVATIQNHLKGTDAVGRWGGEEFGIALPGVNRTTARIVAERIRQTVAHNIMKDLHGRSIPSPTVSQGIAMYPEDAVHIEELIDKADNALFHAKDLGRNQIAEWIDMEHELPKPVALRTSG
ncbi:MAG: diguanylate cyclase [Chloroflexota bacterium]